jgi:hypothetical protein
MRAAHVRVNLELGEFCCGLKHLRADEFVVNFSAVLP